MLWLYSSAGLIPDSRGALIMKRFFILLLGACIAGGGLVVSGCGTSGSSSSHVSVGYGIYGSYPYHSGWGHYPPPYYNHPDRPDRPDRPNKPERPNRPRPERPIHIQPTKNPFFSRPPSNIGRPRPTPRPAARPARMPRTRRR